MNVEKIEKILQEKLLMGHKDLDTAINIAKHTSQTETLMKMLSGKNVFISGSAGTGKTEVIKTYLELMHLLYGDKIKVAVTATTGIAANLINGKTLHSALGIPISNEEFVPSADSYAMGFKSIMNIRKLNVLIIDEVSMLSADLFIKVNKMIQYAKNNKSIFGGLQVILSGDFLQLPPVIRETPISNKTFAFETEEWEQLNLEYCYLDKSFRAKCEDLTSVLSGILNKDIISIKELIKSRFVKEAPKKVSTLFTKNLDVDKFNKERQEKNQNKLYEFEAYIGKGKKEDILELIKQNRISETLELKVDDIVMVTTNVKEENLVNGLIASITAIDDKKELIYIECHNGNTYKVPIVEYKKEERKWELIEGEEPKLHRKTVASIEQYPLKLAYAITVHKSQGQTFDGVSCDLRNCFTEGLGYVALSRATNLESIYITGISENAYKINDECKAFMDIVKFKKNYFDTTDFYNNIMEKLKLRGFPFSWEQTDLIMPNKLLKQESKVVLPKTFDKVTEDVLKYFKVNTLDEIENLPQLIAIFKRVYNLRETD